MKKFSEEVIEIVGYMPLQAMCKPTNDQTLELGFDKFSFTYGLGWDKCNVTCRANVISIKVEKDGTISQPERDMLEMFLQLRDGR